MEKVKEILISMEDEIQEIFENAVVIMLDVFNKRRSGEAISKEDMYKFIDLQRMLDNLVYKMCKYIEKRGEYGKLLEEGKKIA